MSKAQIIQEQITEITEETDASFRSEVKAQLRVIENAQRAVNKAVIDLGEAKKALIDLEPPSSINLIAIVSNEGQPAIL